MNETKWSTNNDTLALSRAKANTLFLTSLTVEVSEDALLLIV